MSFDWEIRSVCLAEQANSYSDCERDRLAMIAEGKRLEAELEQWKDIADTRQCKQDQIDKIEAENARLKRIEWAARRIRDGYPEDYRGTYWEDLVRVLKEYDKASDAALSGDKS